jgi:pimeloyl-ACP methyl ester carboxylesterase
MVHSVEFGSGTPILMIHGFCVDHHLLLGLDSLFVRQGQWRRIYIDLPGMGKSPAGPEIDSADAVAEAVVSFARTTFGAEKFAVLGNSFGGMIARHVVAEFGDQVLGLALLCPVAVAERVARIVPAQTVLQKDPSLLASLDPEDAADYEEMAVVQSTENWVRFRESVLPGLRAFDQDAIQRISRSYDLGREPELRSPKFQGPTVIVTGRQDHVVGFEDQIALSGHYVQSTFAVLDRAGHNAHLDQPGLTGALLSEWLVRMEDGRRGDRSGLDASLHSA